MGMVFWLLGLCMHMKVVGVVNKVCMFKSIPGDIQSTAMSGAELCYNEACAEQVGIQDKGRFFQAPSFEETPIEVSNQLRCRLDGCQLLRQPMSWTAICQRCRWRKALSMGELIANSRSIKNVRSP